MNKDVIKHVKGESIFVNDIPLPEGTLHIAVFDSPLAHGEILNVDVSEALTSEGVIAVITADDIPGENQIGNIIKDETLLAEKKVEYIGEPIAIVVAESEETAKAGKEKINIDIKPLEPITNPREAFEKGQLIAPPVIFSYGKVEDAFEKSDFVIEGTVEIGGQEHLYFETQSSIAIPKEDNGVKIISATQSPTAVQRAAANVLNIPMNMVEVDVPRLGGAFGGKEDQATSWAVMTALACSLLKKPVKLVLNRKEDLRMTGKRHPYSADYKIGLDKEGKILAYEVTYFQNSGAVADLSTAIMERTLFHTTGSYFIPNVKATGYMCRTNLPPNTAFRGFGGPQGMFVIESAIFNAAKKLNTEPWVIQKKNLLKEGDYFYYGQKAERVGAEKTFKKLFNGFEFEKKKNEIEEFNSKNKIFKKGIAVMPLCFGISFTSSFLNQASALVHIYTDGSIGVSTAAVEMGQGVNEKIKIVVAKTFSVSEEKIKIETTNTTRIANTSPTAASTGADLNGNAALIASKSILERLKKHSAVLLKKEDWESVEIIDEKVFYKGEATDITWQSLIASAYMSRVSLSSHAYYSTPDIYFDRKANKGRPFAYHVYGAAYTVAKVDVLRGVYEIEEVNIVHDYGKSLKPSVDIGQTEGAVVQGIGWLTIEEVVQDNKGRLLSNTLSTYKVPDIYSAPKKIAIDFLEDSENPYGPLKSKAIGEPPFMYGISAYFAILNAMKSFTEIDTGKIVAPITHERVLLGLTKSE